MGAAAASSSEQPPEIQPPEIQSVEDFLKEYEDSLAKAESCGKALDDKTDDAEADTLTRLDANSVQQEDTSYWSSDGESSDATPTVATLANTWSCSAQSSDIAAGEKPSLADVPNPPNVSLFRLDADDNSDISSDEVEHSSRTDFWKKWHSRSDDDSDESWDDGRFEAVSLALQEIRRSVSAIFREERRSSRGDGAAVDMSLARLSEGAAGIPSAGDAALAQELMLPSQRENGFAQPASSAEEHAETVSPLMRRTMREFQRRLRAFGVNINGRRRRKSKSLKNPARRDSNSKLDDATQKILQVQALPEARRVSVTRPELARQLERRRSRSENDRKSFSKEKRHSLVPRKATFSEPGETIHQETLADH
eukprot:TRINITY_DN35414_c0_g1_i1.p1 TRINITY_DN35414_c0_g1~~TRINITY_DN35414_c0_g1_i1.p1  ORF type:complete len:367 (-),score=65.32 TRINITY_DN35414_c0_g1_i1:97-1197(-)